MLDSLKKLDTISRGSYPIVTSFDWHVPHQGKSVVERAGPSCHHDEAELSCL